MHRLDASSPINSRRRHGGGENVVEGNEMEGEGVRVWRRTGYPGGSSVWTDQVY